MIKQYIVKTYETHMSVLESYLIIGFPLRLAKKLINIDKEVGKTLLKLRDIYNFGRLYDIVKQKVIDHSLLLQINYYVPEVEEKRKYEDQCPICKSDFNNIVTAQPCNHQFCGNCIMEYWTKELRARLRCPSCRTDIRHFFRNYKIDITSSEFIKDVSKQILAYSRRYGNFSSEYIFRILDFPRNYRSLRNFMGQLYDFIKFLKNLFMVIWLSILILYIISPLDLIPELYFGLVGLIDDFIALGIVLLIVSRFFLFQ